MATSPTYPETPLVKQGTVTPSENGYKATGNSIARIPEIDFVEQFNENINKLSEALSLTRKLSLSEGSIVRRYKWDKTKNLASGTVAEGDLIPLLGSRNTVNKLQAKQFKCTVKTWLSIKQTLNLFK